VVKPDSAVASARDRPRPRGRRTGVAMSGDVFISYSRRDEEFVLRLVGDLEARQAPAWIDRGNIHGGEQWRASIQRGIREARAFVLVISPNSIASANVAEEVTLALQLGKPIIPLVYRRAKIPPALNAQLRRYQFLDFGRGGYGDNVLDLYDALTSLGVPMEIDRAELAHRRDERLGGRVDTQWGAVFARVPGWAFAWALGWALFWVVVATVLVIAQSPDDPRSYVALPFGGFAGGLIGGLFAGLVTMVSLRHNATSIRWRHMSPSIPIWGIVGSIGVIAAGALAFASVQVQEAAHPECTGDLGECLGQAFGQAIGEALAYAFAVLFAIVLYSAVVLFAIGCVAAWLVVRRIRRLEPGIVGQQTGGVVAGWGCGSILAAIAGLVVAGIIGSAVSPT
jgi:TIR domain